MHEVRRGTLDDVERSQQRREAEPDHPGIEAHTQPAERLRIDPADQPRAQRQLRPDLRDDEGPDRDAGRQPDGDGRQARSNGGNGRDENELGRVDELHQDLLRSSLKDRRRGRRTPQT